MTNTPSIKNKLSIQEREAVISKYSLFCLLTANDINKLALLAKEVTINTGEIITKEGAIVDSFYLIIDGSAKVTRTLKRVEKTEVMQIATLGPLDAIGLAETGFFSQSGVRTATVTTLTPMFLLKINLHDFHQFLHQPGVTYPGLRNVGERILIMSFLEKIQIFRNLPNQTLRALADKVEKITVEKGSTIFITGDLGNECYFILKGIIAITMFEHNHIEQTVATLEPPSIFGDKEFLHGDKRTTSANAETNCELLMLNRKKINMRGLQQNLMETQKEVMPHAVLQNFFERFMNYFKKRESR